MSGKRQQQPPRKKRRPTGARRAFRIAYGILVGLSAVIVGVAVAWQFYIKPPDVAASGSNVPPSLATKPPAAVGGGQQGAASEEVPLPKLERKDGYYTIAVGCTDQEGGNTDTLLVASYDTVNQQASLVSIPRDALVLRTFQGGSYKKINAAFANGGGEELTAALGDYLGVPIDCYVVFNLKGIMKMVDLIGGVDFYVPCNMNYDDPLQNLSIHYKKGMYYSLTGQQVMEICRYRDDNYDPALGYQPSGYSNYALGRDETVRNMIQTVASKLLSFSNVDKVQSLADAVFKNLKTDLDARNVAFFINAAFGKFDPGTGLASSSLPGDSDFKYNGVRYYFRADPEAALEVVNTYLNPYTTPVTAEMANLTPAG